MKDVFYDLWTALYAFFAWSPLGWALGALIFLVLTSTVSSKIGG